MSTTLRVNVKGQWFTVKVEDLLADPVVTFVDGEEVPVHISGREEDTRPDTLAQPETAEVPAVAPSPPVSPEHPAAIKTFSSPMPGVILSVAVKIGDQVITGDEICVLEAMKMQQTLRAEWSGIVQAVHVGSGQQVLDGDPLVDLA
jgi:biotin carboxyl carrier protein